MVGWVLRTGNGVYISVQLPIRAVSTQISNAVGIGHIRSLSSCRNDCHVKFNVVLWVICGSVCTMISTCRLRCCLGKVIIQRAGKRGACQRIGNRLSDLVIAIIGNRKSQSSPSQSGLAGFDSSLRRRSATSALNWFTEFRSRL